MRERRACVSLDLRRSHLWMASTLDVDASWHRRCSVEQERYARIKGDSAVFGPDFAILSVQKIHEIPFTPFDDESSSSRQ